MNQALGKIAGGFFGLYVPHPTRHRIIEYSVRRDLKDHLVHPFSAKHDLD